MVQFRPAGAAIIRAAPDVLDLPSWPDLAGTAGDSVPQWREWLARLWQDEALAEAIELASPDLATAVRAVCDGRTATPRRIRRAVESMTWYLLRMTSRATPFGTFAGVAPVDLAARAAVTWGPEHRAVARPEPAWLDQAVTALETDRDLFRRLNVVVNNLSAVRDDALVIACQPCGGTLPERGPCDILIPISRPLRIVLEAARCPVTVAALTGKLSAEFPHAPEPVLDRMLRDLVACRVLIPDLYPPMHVTDPLSHIIGHAAAAASDPGGLHSELKAIGQDLAGYADAPAARLRRRLRERALSRMTTVSAGHVAVDLRLDLRVAVPPQVIAEATAAASALVRLTPYPRGRLHWQQWHRLFLDQYGPGAVVPVAEAVNPGTGIGYPAGYRGSPRKPPPDAAVPARDRALLRLAQNAALDGCREVRLDKDALDQLAAGTGIERVVPHTELRFAVHAATPAAVDRGDFTLVVTSATRQAGTSIGRFLHLLGTAEATRAAGVLTGLPTLTDGAVIAQVSCPPLTVRAQNLTRTPPVFPLISLAEYPHPGTDRILPEDLAITGDARGLFLVSLPTGRVVEPVQLNALEFRARTHPLARFLCELPTALAAPCVPFTWGAAAGLPFLPRVRYHRAVLCPATWNITARDLPGRAAPWRDWAGAWARLRESRRIPRSALLGERDMLAGLDLDEPAHLAALRARVNRKGEVTLLEGPDADAYGWVGGRPHEIALPLASTAPPGTPPAVVSHPAPLRANGRVIRIPGVSRWLHARLHTHSGTHAGILTRHLPALLDDWPGGRPAAWFVRCGGPEPHLRLCIPLPGADAFGPAACRLGAWAGGLRRAGLAGDLVLDTYRPQNGRFGDGPVLQAAEAVFAADSAAAIAQLAATSAGSPDPLAMTAASLTDLAVAFTGSTRAAMTWLAAHPAGHAAGPPARDLRTQTLWLADPETGHSAIAGLPAGPDLLRSWDQRRDAARGYRSRLRRPGRPDPDLVLADLLSLHHARMNGTEAEAGRACYGLARAVALSWTARTQGAPDAR